MKPIRFFVMALAVGSSALAVEVGQTWDEVVAELGKPINRLDAPGRSIGRWANLEVNFENDRVTTVVSRDLAAEAASEDRRKQAAEAARKLREELAAENLQRETDLQARDERERPGRERKALEGRIASMELQLETERAKLRKLTEEADVQRKQDQLARSATLRKELAALRLEIKDALAKSEVQKASRLESVLRAKAKELQSLQ
jgi:cysteinyl-tRNA synthetase